MYSFSSGLRKFYFFCRKLGTMIIRKRYVELLRQYRDKPLIKVVTGIRRCGKSTLLEMY
jgi:predicted AAA+ superfamily ATPase